MTLPNLYANEKELDLWDKAQRLANKYRLTLVSTLKPKEPQLIVNNTGVELSFPSLGTPTAIDFTTGKHAYRRRFGGGKNQLIAKAVGLRGQRIPTVVDATAGFGMDAFVLATLGCQITLVERHPAVALLLEDALIRASSDDIVGPIIERMTIIHNDANDFLATIVTENKPDCIYLDPMYPTRTKSAEVKKPMKLLQFLNDGAEHDSCQLLAQSLQTAKKRVIVKRPKKAEAIVGPKPNHQITGQTTRYDVYLT